MRTGPFQMLISTIDHSPYLGRLGIGRIERGMAHVGDVIALLPLDPNQKAEQSRITKLFAFEGLDRIEVPEAQAGEIVALAGLEGVEIGLTITDLEHPGAARGHRRRGADDLGRLHRQQLALRRQGREVRHVATGARAPVQGARAERGAPRGRHAIRRTRGRCRDAASCTSRS